MIRKREERKKNWSRNLLHQIYPECKFFQKKEKKKTQTIVMSFTNRRDDDEKMKTVIKTIIMLEQRREAKAECYEIINFKGD